MNRIEDIGTEIRKEVPDWEKIQGLWKEFEIDWWYYLRDIGHDYDRDVDDYYEGDDDDE
jgi:hypothetical protein